MDARMAVRIVSVVKANDELGYGFTVTGERPAVLTAIQQGSAADRAGLTAGDHVLEINGQNVEEATHEKIVALVGRTRNAIQLIIVSHAEISQGNVAALAERERALQASFYRTRAYPPGHPHTGERMAAEAAQVSPQPMSTTAVGAGGGAAMMDGGAGHAYDMATTAAALPASDGRHYQHTAAAAAVGMDRERSRSIGHADGMRRRYSHLEAVANGLLPPGIASRPSVGEVFSPNQNLSNSPALAARRSIPKSTSDHGGSVSMSGAPRGSAASLERHSHHDTQSIESDASANSSQQQLAGAERHVYPVQVAYFGSVPMKGDLSEQAERLRVTRDCVSECRKQHRRPQTVTMHISQKGIRLVWTNNSGTSETLFISRSAVALTWVDPSDHRVFSLVQRERVYNGSVSSTSSRSSADKTMVQMKGHVFKVLPNVFDSFQPEGSSHSPDNASSQSAWPIIRLLKYMYGGKSDRKASRAPSESSFLSATNRAAAEGGVAMDQRRASSESPGFVQGQTRGPATSSAMSSMLHPSPEPHLRNDGRGGSLPRNTSAAALQGTNGRSGSPESYTSNTSVGVTFTSPSNQYFQPRRSMDSDDLGVMQDHMRLGAPNFASTPHRQSALAVPPSRRLAHDRHDVGGDSHYSPQVSRRASALGNRSGSLDSVYDSSMTSSGGPTSDTLQQPAVKRVAQWATNFKSLLDDPYGVSLFLEHTRSIYCCENLEFWLEVQRFKSVQDPEEMDAVGREIYADFIDHSGNRQVNLDSKVYSQLKESKDSKFGPTSYDSAQQEIFKLMKSDSHRKFLGSDAYKTCFSLELDGKPLPDAAARSTSSNEEVSGGNRLFSTKRKGFFGFLKKDRKDKTVTTGDDPVVHGQYSLQRPASRIRSDTYLNTPVTQGSPQINHSTAGGLTISKAARKTLGNLYENPSSTKSAKWSGSLPWRKHTSTQKRRARLEIHVSNANGDGGEQNNSFVRSSTSSTVAPVESVLQQAAAGDNSSQGGKSTPMPNSEVMFRVTLPDSTSSTIAKAASIVSLQDAVRPIALRKGLLVDSVDFYEVYPDGTEMLVPSSASVGDLITNNVHIRLVPLINVMLPSGSVEYCRAQKDKSIKDILAEPLANHQLRMDCIAVSVERKDGDREAVDINTGSLSMADRQLIVEVVQPPVASPTFPTSPTSSTSPTSPASPLTSPTGSKGGTSSGTSVKRNSSFRFPFTRRRSQQISRHGRNSTTSDGPDGIVQDGTQTLPKGFRTSSSGSSIGGGHASSGTRSSSTERKTSGSTGSGATGHPPDVTPGSSPTKKRTSIVEELDDPRSPAHDLFDMLDRLQGARLDDQRDASLSSRRSSAFSLQSAEPSLPSSPPAHSTLHHGRGSSMAYGSLPRGFSLASSTDAGLLSDSPAMSPIMSPLSDHGGNQISSESRDSSTGGGSSLQRRAEKLRRQSSDTSMGAGAPSMPPRVSVMSSHHHQASGYHSLERRPRSRSLQMAVEPELRRTSSVANVLDSSSNKPSSLDRRIRQRLAALTGKGKGLSSASSASSGTAQISDSMTTTYTADKQAMTATWEGSERPAGQNARSSAKPLSRPSSGRGRERPDHVEDFFRNFNPRVRDIL